MTEKMNTYRTTAKIVGLLFVAGMVIGVGGMYSSYPFLVLRIPFQTFLQTACW
jgi:hypothetical protein